MKISVSVPKDLSKQLDAAAYRMGISPSEVVRRAVREFVDNRSSDATAGAERPVAAEQPAAG